MKHETPNLAALALTLKRQDSGTMWDPFRCSHVDMARQEVTFLRPFNSHIAAPCQVMTRPGRGRAV